MTSHYLRALFEPASVALVGATERSEKLGARLMQNLLAAGFSGELFAVNPKYRSVSGVPCVASLTEIPRPVDLAVIATPAVTVPGLIEDCGKAGIRAAVIVTAGFSETGPAGAALEHAVLDAAHRHGVRILGPNCLGIISHVRPRGDRLAVITNGGGPGVMAADRAAELGDPMNRRVVLAL